MVNSDTKGEAGAKKKAFNRALKAASDDELIGLRHVNGETLIWMVSPDDGASKSP